MASKLSFHFNCVALNFESSSKGRMEPFLSEKILKIVQKMLFYFKTSLQREDFNTGGGVGGIIWSKNKNIGAEIFF